jgi:release factor glutamine methyltransferase
VDAAARRLERAAVPEPRREAEIVMAHLLGKDRGGVVARRPDPLDEALRARFETLVARRERREPLQYLTGEQEFMGLPFRVDSRVLVPRPETEGVVTAALGLGLPAGARVADLGTGSGCISIALAVARPDLGLHALDISGEALEVARWNAERLGVGTRIDFVLSDLAEPPAEWSGTMDAVLSNPPYVAEDEWAGLSPEVRDYEPRVALVPGPSGLEAYRRVAASAIRLLVPGGCMVVELGFKREGGARDAATRAGLTGLEVLPDLRGIPRVLLARRP